MKSALRFAGALLLSVGLAAPAFSTEYPLPAADSRLIGENQLTTVPDDKRPLEAIAAKYQIGLLSMLEANPGTDPWLPKAGTQLVVPQQMLLPDTPREGIVVNLAELRLYYYPKGEDKVIVYPIGIGQLGAATPVMVTSISQKIPNPTWTPTVNIRKRYAKDGVTLPAVVPAGPENPMGLFALRLARGSGNYLIHGTNADFGIGMRVSSGCIRLRPQDIEALFNSVPKGTRVQVINQPVKYAVEPDGKRYVEVHQPLSHSDKDDPQTMPIALSPAMKKFIKSPQSDSALIKAALERRSGMPVLVSSGEAVAAPSEAASEQAQSAQTTP
ncbi:MULTISPECIES: L,D-transpeptidase family protein [Pantoea]|jgi:L,D-transpeptidase YcfS|uniref:L,D-transpeptidase family protein n=1 Tax=Pantoea TaxID=53335 RepID=UPI0006601492|nr:MULTISPECIES: L,D-transpeptidase family protein [Pantoea]MBS6436709.1 L,D-transpeptidase family protein [Pantoea sp.]MDU1572614.1 L,D-transpeptidase family protein [Pantoea sp.]MDU2727757.1 L,D-transpeptidase family protein [Pantoea sp.]